ncbi:MAG TPA: hypothetical protein DCS63_03805 [Elusimicrobia bacterium]|nr:hypothetical protein [Elusimicrobiota bacterium]
MVKSSGGVKATLKESCMAKIFSAAILMSLSFYCVPAFAGESAFSELEQSGAAGVPAPAPSVSEAAAFPEAEGSLDLWNEYIGKNFGGTPARAEQQFYKSAGGEVVDTINLKNILDKSLRSGLTFTTSANTVHVSGAEALNCPNGGTNCSSKDKYFLLFTTAKGQTVFVRGKDVANALFMSGEKEISFRGDVEKYKVRVDVVLSNPGTSRLKIETSGRTALNVSLNELAAALLTKGRPLTVGARHNLYYNTGVLQDAQGNGRFARENIFIFAQRGEDSRQIVRASQIGPSGVVLPSVEKNFGFRILGDDLEIYAI